MIEDLERFRAHALDLIARLEPFAESRAFEFSARGEARGLTGQDVAVFADAMRHTLLAALASLGECKAQTPFSPIAPEIRSDGTSGWCCSHQPNRHCM